jgi:hypothetical protein
VQVNLLVLFQEVDRLYFTSECDVLDEQNAITEKEIGRYEALANMNNTELHSKVKEMSEEAELLK